MIKIKESFSEVTEDIQLRYLEHGLDYELQSSSLYFFGKNLKEIIKNGKLLEKIFKASKDIVKQTADKVRSNKSLLRLHEYAQIFISLEKALNSEARYLHHLENGKDWRISVAEAYLCFFDHQYKLKHNNGIEIHLLTSDLCNISCETCKYRCSPGGKVLSLEKTTKICEDLKRFGSVRIIAEASGEPTHPRNLGLLEKLKEHYNGSGEVRVVVNKIVTNGIMIARHPEVLERFYKLGTADIGFSFYSNQEIHDRLTTPGLFGLALKGLENLDKFNQDEKKIRKWVEIILTKGIKPEDIDFYFNLDDVDGFQIVPLVPSGRASDDWNRFALDLNEYIELEDIFEKKREELPKDTKMKILNLGSSFLGSGVYRRIVNRGSYCNAGKQRAFVNAIDGEIYPCPFFAGYRGLALGNIFKPTKSISKNFEIAWFEQKNPEYLKREDFNAVQEIEPSGLCKKCEHKTYCNGGCLAMSYAFHLNEAIKNGTANPRDILHKSREQRLCRYGWRNN